jgi:hypothetical protein
MTKSIELTAEQAQVLVNLINIAVKTQGLDAAEAALFFTKKIQEAFNQEKNQLEVKK